MINDTSGGAMVAGMLGTGKTVVAVETAIHRNAGRILIAAPKNTFGFHRPGFAKEYDGWVGTLRRQGWTGPITIVTKRSDLTHEEGAFIIGREFMTLCQKDTKKESGIDWTKQKQFDLVIYDEVHGIANRKTEAFKTVKRIKAGYKVGLSGTPYRSNFDGMWAPCRWLWPEHLDLIPKSYWLWRAKWCRTETVYLKGGATTEKVVGEKNPGEFVLTLPNYHRLERESMVVPATITVDLTPAQRKQYTQMEKDQITFVNEGANVLVADNGLVGRIRAREMTLGVVSVDPETGELYFAENCKSTKLDAAQEFMKDRPEQHVIFGTHSAKFAPVAAKRLGAELWTGATSDEEREAIKDRFLAGESTRIVSTVRSFSTGIDGFQDVCSLMIFLSRDEQDVENEQWIGRTDRRGQTEQVNLIDILATDTLDEGDYSKETQAYIERMTTLRV